MAPTTSPACGAPSTLKTVGATTNDRNAMMPIQAPTASR